MVGQLPNLDSVVRDFSAGRRWPYWGEEWAGAWKIVQEEARECALKEGEIKRRGLHGNALSAIWHFRNRGGS